MRVRNLLVGLALAGTAAVAVGIGSGDETEGAIYRVELDNAFGLTEGGDLRIADVRAGRTTAFDITNTDPRRAVVTVEVTDPAFAGFRDDASCAVRQQSLIGEYYLDCQPGKSGDELEPGGVIPVEQTASTVPLDLLNDVMREPYADRFRLILGELGAGLVGRPDDLSAAIERAVPALRRTDETLSILGRQTSILERFVSDADTVVAALDEKRSDVARFVREAGATAEVAASRADELGRGFERLPEFVGQLGPYMAALDDAAREQTPLLAGLRRGAPDLDRFLARVGPFSDAARPALAALGDASEAGSPALRASRSEMRAVRAIASRADEVGTPLRQLLVSLDDRGRATYPDKRALPTAPPSPDPTARNAGRGFTGYEALLNWVFWGTTAISSYDDFSHFLRLHTVFSPCSIFTASPSRRLIEGCNVYLGPNQPGVENATGIINGQDFGEAESGNISDATTRVAASGRKKGGGSDRAHRAGRGRGGAGSGGRKRRTAPGDAPGDSGAGLLPRALDPTRRLPSVLPPSARPPGGSSTTEPLLDFLLGR